MADKARKRSLSARQRTSTLFCVWHNLQDMKAEAEHMGDGELVLLLGMAELLVEDRVSGLNVAHRAMLTPTDGARPN
jgi:hypothetical protein